MNELDFIILALIIMGVIIGFKKGLISSLSNIGASIIGILIAFFSFETIVLYLEETYAFISKIAQYLEEKMPVAVNADGDNLIYLLIYQQFGFSQTLPAYLAYLITAALVFIIIYFLVSALFRSLLGTLEGVFKVWPLTWMDKIGGAILHGLKNILIISVALGFLLPVIETASNMEIEKALFIKPYMEHSTLLFHFIDLFSYIKLILGIA